nr:hypothetical protein Iba_chr05cCG2370 [Ipomoea batatas]
MNGPAATVLTVRPKPGGCKVLAMTLKRATASQALDDAHCDLYARIVTPSAARNLALRRTDKLLKIAEREAYMGAANLLLSV